MKLGRHFMKLGRPSTSYAWHITSSLPAGLHQGFLGLFLRLLFLGPAGLVLGRDGDARRRGAPRPARGVLLDAAHQLGEPAAAARLEGDEDGPGEEEHDRDPEEREHEADDAELGDGGDVRAHGADAAADADAY